MNLYNIIDIEKDNIVTVVGAGGKTSLINYLAKYYKDNYKVLLTTTTKIFKPKVNFEYKIFMLNDNRKIDIQIDRGLIVCGQYINEEEKIVGIDFKDLDTITKNFDLTLIEGDGSKRKKIKGWNQSEPVVYTSTKKVIGVLDITAFDMDVNEENIHRLEEFKKITKINSSKKITIDNLYDIVLNENGLFKNSIGEKVLFINKVENTYYENLTKKLINCIEDKAKDINIAYGSIKNGILKRG